MTDSEPPTEDVLRLLTTRSSVRLLQCPWWTYDVSHVPDYRAIIILALTLLVVLLRPTLQREGPTYARSMAEAFRACLLADLCLPIEHQQSTDYLGAYEDMAPREDIPNSAVATSVT